MVFSQCAICLGATINAVQCNPCEHIFCAECLHLLAKANQLDRFWLRTTSCPTCRQLILWTKSLESRRNRENWRFPGRFVNRFMPVPWMEQLHELDRALLEVNVSFLTLSLLLFLSGLIALCCATFTLSQRHLSIETKYWMLIGLRQLLPVLTIGMICLLTVYVVFVS